MKHLLLMAILIAAAWFGWKHFSTRGFDGKEVAESDRVTYVSASDFSSVTDLLSADHWTIVLFTGPGAPEGPALERRLESTVRQRVNTVRLVIIDVGDLASSVATRHELKVLPTAWLYDGIGRTSTDLEQILKRLG